MNTEECAELLDVTLRDGGYVNGWDFSTPTAVRIVSALAKAGVPYIEVGYYQPRLTSNGTSRPGPKCCAGSYLDAVARVKGRSGLSAMVHLSDVQPDDYAFLADHGVSLVRFVISTPSIPRIEAHLEAVHRAGLICSLNLIRLSERTPEEVISCARRAEEMGADWLYTADSNGSMFPDDIEELYRELSREVHIPLGFHAHDSLKLAFANSLASLRVGGRLLDSSLGGMGKGAGNLVTELITAYLKSFFQAQFDVAELANVACETLGQWISPTHSRTCENILSALLDLNADDLKRVSDAARKAERSLLLELEYGLNHVGHYAPAPGTALVLPSGD